MAGTFQTENTNFLLNGWCISPGYLSVTGRYSDFKKLISVDKLQK